MEEKKAIIEALLFASETPLSVERIAEILAGAEKAFINGALQELAGDYEERKGGIYLQAVAGGYQFQTRPDLSAWVKKLRTAKPVGVSPAAMETLAIIAYRQPVVKADIDRFRGVDTAGALRGLLEKKLVRIVGRKDVPGKPILYGTTRKFLEVFNLQDLSALPTLRELKELQE
jgi:segregation and condensation protein B